jgi:hypothetical protein
MGKNSVPKTPNYQPLIDMQKASAQQSYDLAKRQQDWAEKTYNDNKAISDQVVQKSMAAMDEQMENARADRARYQSVFQPLENTLVSDATSYASPERQEMEAGKASADVAANFGAARQAAQDRLEAYGVDPSSTRAGALDLGTRIAQGAASASASNVARQQTIDRGMALRDEAINLGRGYAGQAAGEYSGSGQAGNAAVNTGLAQTASGAQTMGTGQSYTQLGNQSLGSWGNLLGQNYNNQMAQYKAKQSQSSGWGSVLGMGAGLLTKGLTGGFAAEGGVLPAEEDIYAAGGGPIPVAASPSGGAVTDDVPAQAGAIPMQMNAGEFVVPKDVTQWLGEKGLQDLILKARKQMQSPQQRPAVPTQGPVPQAQGVPPQQPGAIPPPGG